MFLDEFSGIGSDKSYHSLILSGFCMGRVARALGVRASFGIYESTDWKHSEEQRNGRDRPLIKKIKPGCFWIVIGVYAVDNTLLSSRPISFLFNSSCRDINNAVKKRNIRKRKEMIESTANCQGCHLTPRKRAFQNNSWKRRIIEIPN